MLTWWAFQDERQELLELSNTFEIEHIFAKNRQENERSLNNPENIDVLGNKSLLEKRINIRASDYRFEDKKKYYKGFINARGVHKEGTKIEELLFMADHKDDYTEQDIKDSIDALEKAKDKVTYTIEFDVIKDKDGNWKLTSLDNETIKKIQGMY